MSATPPPRARDTAGRCPHCRARLDPAITWCPLCHARVALVGAPAAHSARPVPPDRPTVVPSHPNAVPAAEDPGAPAPSVTPSGSELDPALVAAMMESLAAEERSRQGSFGTRVAVWPAGWKILGGLGLLTLLVGAMTALGRAM